MLKISILLTLLIAMTACTTPTVHESPSFVRAPSAEKYDFTFRVSPATYYYDITDEKMNTVYRYDGRPVYNETRRNFSVYQSQSKGLSEFYGSLPDGLYRLTVGKDITDYQITQLIFTVENGQVKNTRLADPKSPGIFKIEALPFR